MLVTGLVQLAYLLEGLADRATTSRSEFDRDPVGRLFVWEAFVSGALGPFAPPCDPTDHTAHACDAIAAARAAHAWLGGMPPEWAYIRTVDDLTVDVDRGLDLVRTATGAPAIVDDLRAWGATVVQMRKPRPHDAARPTAHAGPEEQHDSTAPRAPVELP